SVAGPDLLGVGVGGILPDTQFFPLYPLNNPPDQSDNSLFEYIFGANAHSADSTSHLLDADGNKVDDATDFLVSNFTPISDCSSLGISSQGFLYTPKGTGCT